jgi:hypothetical protein
MADQILTVLTPEELRVALDESKAAIMNGARSRYLIQRKDGETLVIVERLEHLAQ